MCYVDMFDFDLLTVFGESEDIAFAADAVHGQIAKDDQAVAVAVERTLHGEIDFLNDAKFWREHDDGVHAAHSERLGHALVEFDDGIGGVIQLEAADMA